MALETKMNRNMKS